ncbi:hypothetical protein WDU94_015160 [Cyamophila willieti]
MADIAEDFKENLTEAVKNATAKIPATPEGMAVAYGSLVAMALLPIFFGAHRSVKYHNNQKELGETPETMTRKDAAMFPVVASIALFTLYLVFQFFSKDMINLLLTGYFFLLGVLALCYLLSPVISPLVPAAIPNIPFFLKFDRGSTPEEKKEGSEALLSILDYKFSSHDIVCFIVCSVFGSWYLVKKHWIANNLFGLAFAVNGIELLHLNNVMIGVILLCGLFIYDIFWVFGTNVMVTVAKSFEAPIKLVFPQDLLEHGVSANNFAMLGLGDIVVPGIFIALLLRFDLSLKRSSNTYFNTAFLAYFLGLMATIFVMHVFKHAQPALLYLVPACLGLPLLVALIKGDLSALIKYEDHPSKPDEAAVKQVASSATVNNGVDATEASETPVRVTRQAVKNKKKE